MRLSDRAFRKLCRDLLDRQQARGDPGIVAVGMGRALKRGRHDPSRAVVVHYFVRKKRRLSANHRHRIPRRISHTGRGGGRRTFFTDIIEVPRCVPTGVQLQSSTDYFTAGYVLRYGDPAVPQWCLLSVGHAVPAGAAQVAVAALNDSRPVLHSTLNTDPNDASLIGITGDDLAKLSMAQYDGTTPALPFYPRPTAINPASPLAANCDSVAGYEPISVVSITGATDPNHPVIDGLPNVGSLLYAHAVQPNTFARGTSGSSWVETSGSVAAVALQTGGVPATGFVEGYGQLLDDLLDWAENQLGMPVTLVGWI